MKKIKQCDKCPYHALVMDFTYRVHNALKPATKMWQKKHNKPLYFLDSVELIKWLIKEAKHV